jgi:AcrR family transcriptional regulator
MRRANIDLQRLAGAFAPDGLHGVSVNEIARAAGVAKPTLYRDHGSKEELFAACVAAEVERMLERVHVAYARSVGASLATLLAALADALLQYAQEQPASFRLLLVTAPHRTSAVAEEVAQTLERIPDRLAELLTRHPAWPEGADAELRAVALLATAVGLVRRARQPWDRAADAERLGALLAPRA